MMGRRLELTFFAIVVLCVFLLTFITHNPGTTRFRAPQPTFAVIFDAGSTGSRVHVFRLDPVSRQLMPIGPNAELSAYSSISGGLSSFADSPDSLRPGIRELAKFAFEATEKYNRPKIFAFLGATAGLRLLPEEKRATLLTVATNEISEIFPSISGRVIDGQEEARFLWETVSFLTRDDSAVVVDLGGGSVQLAYRSPRPPASEQERHFLQPLPDGSHLYLHSWLGFGLKAARMGVLKQKTSSACVKGDSVVEYEYGAECVKVTPAASGNCHEEVINVMAVGSGCSPGLKPCAFSGGWRGPVSDTAKVYLFSFVFDICKKLGLIPEGVFHVQLSVSEITNSAKRVCEDTKEDDFLCLDASYVATLIHRGLGFPLSQPVIVADHIGYNGVNFEAAWPLGAALTQLAS